MSDLSQNDLPSSHFRIMVTSIKKPTFTEIKSAYECLDYWREVEYEEVELHKSLRRVTPTAGDKVVFLKAFNKHTTSEKAFNWARRNGYRLAFPSEREAFSKAYPDLQRKSWIVDLGSGWLRTYDSGILDLRTMTFHDGRRATVLGEIGGQRVFSGYWFDTEWRTDLCFLFVRK